MKILVLNSGSSSVKYKLFESDSLEVLFDGIEEEIIDFHKSFENIFDKLIFSKAINSLEDISAFGHRVVHGGEKFSKPVIIDDEVILELEKLIPLAPLHNPSNIDGIKTIKAKIQNSFQVAVFDTAFHQTLPMKSFLYPIPFDLYEKHKIRKYGFHGTSHQYVAKEYAAYLNTPLENLNLITIHLGNGASITAIENGKSIDTSMGFTPLEGLMMGTRCGDIDPSIVLYLQENLNLTTSEVSDILNKQSGLKGICEQSDLREVLSLCESGIFKAQLSVDMFVEKIRNYLGNYLLKLGKVDGVIFTGGIGENSAIIREKVCEDLFDLISLELDIDKNNQKLIENMQQLSTKNSKIKIFVIKTDEEKSIAIQTKGIKNK